MIGLKEKHLTFQAAYGNMQALFEIKKETKKCQNQADRFTKAPNLN